MLAFEGPPAAEISADVTKVFVFARGLAFVPVNVGIQELGNISYPDPVGSAVLYQRAPEIRDQIFLLDVLVSPHDGPDIKP
jgi:hypothetical protein